MSNTNKPFKLKIFGLGFRLAKHYTGGWQYGWHRPAFGISSLIHGGIRTTLFKALKAAFLTYKTAKRYYEQHKQADDGGGLCG